MQFHGHRHTLLDVAEKLFDNYLRDAFDEDLDAHLWRFQPTLVAPSSDDFDEDDAYGLALNTKIPILSPSKGARDQFKGRGRLHRYRLKTGSTFMLHYDEGRPTLCLVAVDRLESRTRGGEEDAASFPKVLTVGGVAQSPIRQPPPARKPSSSATAAAAQTGWSRWTSRSRTSPRRS